MTGQKKKILIISSQKPYYGGAATTAYNLTKLLSKDFDVSSYFINSIKATKDEIDPDSINNAFSINLFINGFIGKMVRTIDYLTNSRKLNNVVLYFKIKYVVNKNKINPDLVIVNIPVYYNLIYKLFKHKRVLFLVNGHAKLINEWNSKTDAISLIFGVENKTKSVKTIKLFPKNSKANVLFNSGITQKLYASLNHYDGKSDVLFFNLTKKKNFDLKSFSDRKYDLAVIVSCFNRRVKNTDLALQLFNHFPNLNKIAIGDNSNKFIHCPNTEIHSLIHQEEVYKLLNDVKLVLITSYYDSSPGLQAEAILMGANVLSSRNIGWSEKLDSNCLISNYFDLDEWKDKTLKLVQEQQQNLKFHKVLNNSDQNIKGYLNLILNNEH